MESSRYIYDNDDLSDFDIIAPNLKCVAWKADMFVFQNVEKCTRLEKVELLLQPLKHDALVLFEVLCGMSKVKHLTLNQCFKRQDLARVGACVRARRSGIA